MALSLNQADRANAIARGTLFGFLVDRVLVAMGAEFLQLHAPRGIPTVFHGGVPGHPCGPLVGVGATLGAFQRNDDSDALPFGHNLLKPIFGWTTRTIDTIVNYFIGSADGQGNGAGNGVYLVGCGSG